VAAKHMKILPIITHNYVTHNILGKFIRNLKYQHLKWRNCKRIINFSKL